MNKVVVGDSDGLIALVSRDDINHDRAVAIADKLEDDEKTIFFPNTTIIETITHLIRAKNNSDKAHLINQQFLEGKLHIIYVDEEIQKRAGQIFETTKSKQNTLFDAVVVACAESLDASEIFSFDKWYPKLGFKLTQT